MKGTTLTSIVLEVLDFEPDNFEAQLSQKVASAPQFFTRSSLILHLIKPLSATEFELLVALCRRLQLQPMAVKGEVAELKPTINDLGLADVSQSKFTDSTLRSQKTAQSAEVKSESTTNSDAESTQSQNNEPAAPAKAEAISPPAVATLKPAKVINRPVRSGQQVYAEGSDLVVTASVSEGAELLADGAECGVECCAEPVCGRCVWNASIVASAQRLVEEATPTARSETQREALGRGGYPVGR